MASMHEALFHIEGLGFRVVRVDLQNSWKAPEAGTVR